MLDDVGGDSGIDDTYCWSIDDHVRHSGDVTDAVMSSWRPYGPLRTSGAVRSRPALEEVPRVRRMWSEVERAAVAAGDISGRSRAVPLDYVTLTNV